MLVCDYVRNATRCHLGGEYCLSLTPASSKTRAEEASLRKNSHLLVVHEAVKRGKRKTNIL